MLKKSLIAVVTAVVLSGTAISATTPASASPTGYIEIHAGSHWKGKGHHRHGFRQHRQRQACTPVVRWRMVGYRYHRHWQKVVVGWNCNQSRHHNRGRWNTRWR